MKQYRKAKQPKKAMGQRTARIISSIIIYALLVIMCVFWLFPFLCLLLDSLKVETNEAGQYLTAPFDHIWPRGWGFRNYKELFTTKPFLRWYLNTFIIAIFTSIFQTINVLAMAYALSRLRFKGRKGLMNFMLILGMFPGFLSMILLYKVLADLKMTGSGAIPGLILVYVASSGMGYYVSKGYFDTIPRSLDEAARVDGASRFQVFYKIIIPLSKPIVIYTILTGFMGPWGDFLFASYIAHGYESGMNVAAGLNNLISKDNSLNANYAMFCAAGVLVAIPVTSLFMFLQKYYVEGVTGGAVKG